jgi:hypothetical protein
MLHDHPSDGFWGLVHTNYSPKLSADYLHNLTAILADKSYSSFTPENLDYSIPAKPAAVHDLLMQKSNGAFELAVWCELAKGTNSVIVELGSVWPRANLYDPTVGTNTFKTLSNVSSVSLRLSDHPIIIELRRE